MGFGGWTMLKAHRKQAERAQLALEQILDRLEHGALPRSALPSGANPLLSETITAVAQGVRDVAKAVGVSKSLIYNRMRKEWASALAEGTAK